MRRTLDDAQQQLDIGLLETAVDQLADEVVDERTGDDLERVELAEEADDVDRALAAVVPIRAPTLLERFDRPRHDARTDLLADRPTERRDEGRVADEKRRSDLVARADEIDSEQVGQRRADDGARMRAVECLELGQDDLHVGGAEAVEVAEHESSQSGVGDGLRRCGGCGGLAEMRRHVAAGR